MVKIYFSHGKDSGPQATKILALEKIAKSSHLATHSIDYRGIDVVEQRIAKLTDSIKNDQSQNNRDEKIILVGSSMGAYVSLGVAQKYQPLGLFLMAPAVLMQGYPEIEPPSKNIPIKIIHGWHDEIVPVENAVRFAQKYNSKLILVPDDHQLSQSLPFIEKQFRLFLESIL